MRNKILNYCLENASTQIVQQAVKDCNLLEIAYSMKISLVSEYPELRETNSGTIGLNFGLAASEAFENYKVDTITLKTCLNDIDNYKRVLKLLGKYHPEYLNKCLLHDAIVDVANELQKPINEFLRLYKKAQKAKGKNISVRKRKEIILPKPIL